MQQAPGLCHPVFHMKGHAHQGLGLGHGHMWNCILVAADHILHQGLSGAAARNLIELCLHDRHHNHLGYNLAPDCMHCCHNHSQNHLLEQQSPHELVGLVMAAAGYSNHNCLPVQLADFEYLIDPIQRRSHHRQAEDNQSKVVDSCCTVVEPSTHQVGHNHNQVAVLVDQADPSLFEAVLDNLAGDILQTAMDF